MSNEGIGKTLAIKMNAQAKAAKEVFEQSRLREEHELSKVSAFYQALKLKLQEESDAFNENSEQQEKLSYETRDDKFLLYYGERSEWASKLTLYLIVRTVEFRFDDVKDDVGLDGRFSMNLSSYDTHSVSMDHWDSNQSRASTQTFSGLDEIVAFILTNFVNH